MNSGTSLIATSGPLTPPVNSGSSPRIAASSPFAPPVNSGTSLIAASAPLTLPVNSGSSPRTTASSPFTPPANSGSSWLAASAPLTLPVNSGTSWIAGSVLPVSTFLVPTNTISSCAASTTSLSFSVRLPSNATSVMIRSLPSRPTWDTLVLPSGRVGSSCFTVLKRIGFSTTSRLGWLMLNSLTPPAGSDVPS